MTRRETKATAEDSLAVIHMWATKYKDLARAASGEGIGSPSSVADELLGAAELLDKDGHHEWAGHLRAKAKALREALDL